jgi:hypothetical protein
MLDGVMLLWFVLAAASLLFVAVDIRTTPESKVMKWGFVLVTAYTGVVGAFLYVLGCREPLPGLHERYTATRWRQALGSTMHCGVGILVGAVLANVLRFPTITEVIVEYVLGFGFGWTVFSGVVHARHGRRLLFPLIEDYVRTRVAVDEFPDDRNVANRDDPEEAHSNRWESYDSELLVRDVNGVAGRLRRLLSDKLVASGEQSQAWHDDGTSRERGRRRAHSRC